MRTRTVLYSHKELYPRVARRRRRPVSVIHTVPFPSDRYSVVARYSQSSNELGVRWRDIPRTLGQAFIFSDFFGLSVVFLRFSWSKKVEKIFLLLEVQTTESRERRAPPWPKQPLFRPRGACAAAIARAPRRAHTFPDKRGMMIPSWEHRELRLPRLCDPTNAEHFREITHRPVTFRSARRKKNESRKGNTSGELKPRGRALPIRRDTLF